MLFGICNINSERRKKKKTFPKNFFLIGIFEFSIIPGVNIRNTYYIPDIKSEILTYSRLCIQRSLASTYYTLQ
jgi:hypothetical protein